MLFTHTIRGERFIFADLRELLAVHSTVNTSELIDSDHTRTSGAERWP